MSGHPRQIQDEIAKMVLANPSPLLESVARELADYTVAFVGVKNGRMGPGAVGTLVSLAGEKYFLTAAHVWNLLKKSDIIRIPLKESVPCKFAIRPQEIEPFVVYAGWDNKWGPDMALLRIRPDHAGSLLAVGRNFYSLAMKKEPPVGVSVLIWFLMGAPNVFGKYSPQYSIPDLHGMNVVPRTEPFQSLVVDPAVQPLYDFVEIDVDTTQPNVESNYEGVSGGGFWSVYIYKDENADIKTRKILDGIVFYQFCRKTDLTVRCHGPQSIGELLRSFMSSG